MEKIGTGDEQSDMAFVKLVQSQQFNDYNILFEEINNIFFNKKQSPQYSSSTPAIQLRNAVLKHLKNVM